MEGENTMRQELNEQEMDQVIGGTVILNTSRMRIGFTVLQKAFDVINCSDDDARDLVNLLYKQHKMEGDRALETATLEAFRQNGWIRE